MSKSVYLQIIENAMNLIKTNLIASNYKRYD